MVSSILLKISSELENCVGERSLMSHLPILVPSLGNLTRVLLLLFLKAPNPQSTSDDYIARNQRGLYNNFKPPPGQQYLARGHLVPNADFGSDAERALTFIMTNVAPKWQLFNMGNWFALERAIRTYANRKNRKVYVFSGVGKCQSNDRARNILPSETRFRKSAHI